MDHVWEDPERYRSEVQSALARILADDEFLKSVQPAQFLKFVVEETLEGRGDRLKGYTIAVSALGQRSDFDPQSNSLVRVQACRLRKMLEQYYRGPGSQDSVRIVLSSGSYKPRFEGRSGGPTSAASEEGEQTSSRRRFGWPCARRFATIFLTVSLAIVSAALVVRARQPATATEDGWSYPSAPAIVVESANDVDAGNAAKDAANLTVVALESGLSVFDHFVVKRRADLTGRDKFDYALSVSVGPSSGDISDFTFQLEYLPTKEIVWSRTFPRVDFSAQASIEAMTRDVVSAVGDDHVGAIMADQRSRAAISNAPLQGYFCLVAAYDYILSRDPVKHGPARQCLEREVSLHSRASQPLTLLSVILIDDYINLAPGNEGLADIERAATLAQLAFEISPVRGETSTTMFRSRFYAHRFDDAFIIVPQLLWYLPNSRLLSANVGVAYISRGRYDEGVAILSRLEDANLGAPAFSVPMLALAAYMRGDAETAERFASRATAARRPLGLVVWIAACETEMSQDCVLQATRQLRRDYPEIAADVPTALFRHGLADDIRAKLLSDLNAAGFFNEASR